MTINESPDDTSSQPKPDDSVANVADTYHAPDFVLQAIADFANRVRAGMSFTFFTSAGTFSGDVISGEDYFDEVAQKSLAGVAENPDEKLRELGNSYVDMFLSKQSEFYRGARESDNDSDDPIDLSRVSFIHLREANVTSSAGTFAIGHLRLRLADVAAWKPGKFVVT